MSDYGVKLDEAKVRVIRAKLAQGASRASLAREFGVSHTQIERIEKRQSWKRVALRPADVLRKP